MLKENVKSCLCAVNASYTHTSYARLCLAAACKDYNLQTKEYSVNDRVERMCAELYALDCELYMFSCAIWNLSFLERVASRLKAVKPACAILFGGPEVSYDTENFLNEHAYVDFCMRGEGDESLPKLLSGAPFETVEGLCYRVDNKIVIQPPAIVHDLDVLPQVYDQQLIRSLQNKMIYYETSRGCPFRCSYCLSSTSHGVRVFSLERVFRDLRLFMDEKVSLIKLTDRTFNFDSARTKQILDFILAHNQCTCFHFEVSADLLDEALLCLLESAPKGWFQLEIGIQTTNQQTSEAIDRRANFEKIKTNTLRLKNAGNVHLHLDLIAGLPNEDFESFARSFNDVFSAKPDMLQLGFLKLLKGTKIREQITENGYVFSNEPPYEVLQSKWLSYEDMLRLKRVEEVVDLYYNSGAFKTALAYSMQKSDKTAFEYFESLALYIDEHTLAGAEQSRAKMYAYLQEFHALQIAENDDLFSTLLAYEQLKHNKTAQVGAWANLPTADKKFYTEAWRKVRMSGVLAYEQLDLPQKDLMRSVRIVRVSYDVFTYEKRDTILVIDYQNKNTYSLAVDVDEENNL